MVSSSLLDRMRSRYGDMLMHEGADEIERLRAEVDEQCRLNGMGGERMEPTRDVENERWHIRGDVLRVVRDVRPDLFIVHPPCTYLSVSGQHWVKRGRIEPDGRPRALHVAEAFEFFMDCMAAVRAVGRGGVENPIGIMSTRWRKPDQIVQPYEFGDDASKATCLWLENLPPLRPTQYVEPRMIDGLPRWANQTDSGQNRLGPSDDRAEIRSRTYPGIARAMAEQWP